MPAGDLAAQTADLLRIADVSEARALGRLPCLAARQLPACAGADAAAWRDGELVAAAASHPDLAALAEVQRAARTGPAIDALTADAPVACPDTLSDRRWPEYADAALRRGVRCCIVIAHRAAGWPSPWRCPQPGRAPWISASFRWPRSLVALGGVMLGNAAEYTDSRRTALQLLDAAQSA